MVVSFIYMEQIELSEKNVRMVRAINIILNKFQRSLDIEKVCHVYEVQSKFSPEIYNWES